MAATGGPWPSQGDGQGTPRATPPGVHEFPAGPSASLGTRPGGRLRGEVNDVVVR